MPKRSSKKIRQSKKRHGASRATRTRSLSRRIKHKVVVSSPPASRRPVPKLASPKPAPVPRRDYKTMFIGGVMVFIFGAVFQSIALYTLGLIFAVYGIANRDKWNDQVYDRKKMIIAAVVAVVVAVITGLLIALF